jgi:hypothetical protein
MKNIYVVEAAAQLPPLTATAVTAFNDAIRDARFALHNEPLDRAMIRLEKASRMAGETCNPQARELAYLVGVLAPASETAQLVEMCFRDLFPEL